MEKAVM